jgi:hypothetical protein
MKFSHTLILAVGIILGGTLIAGSNLFVNRYHYTVMPTGGLARIDGVTGDVDAYDMQRGRWFPFVARK